MKHPPEGLEQLYILSCKLGLGSISNWFLQLDMEEFVIHLHQHSINNIYQLHYDAVLCVIE